MFTTLIFVFHFRAGLKKTLIEKLCFIPVILPFMIPVGLVYYFEYLINSGLVSILLNKALKTKQID